MRVRIPLLVVAAMLMSCLLAAAQAQGGTITITCDVEGALVFVDHTMLGKAPLNAVVFPGRHEVRVSAGEDYVPFVTTVDIASGGAVPVHAVLEKTAPVLYREALAALRARNDAEAARLFEAANKATGKRAADIPFYQGLLAERARDTAAAERYFLAWVTVNPLSATGQYHLGRARQALGQTALAATAYKSAVTSAVKGADAIVAGAGAPTAANVSRLEQLSRSPGPAAAAATLQLARLYELKGSLAAARDAYRGLFESLASSRHIDLADPSPADLPLMLQKSTGMAAPPAEPANTMYVTGDDPGAVSSAWKTYTRARATMAGPASVSPAVNRWIALQARVFDTASQEQINSAAQGLSAALHTDVLFLQITRDGRAWYFYWSDGRQLDKYCSNPGHADEVDYRTLRAWAGKPDVLARICRGKPLSSKSAAPSMTDLNAILYYYYPELRVTRPAAWRSPAAFMKMLASVVGLPGPPARFGAR